MKNKRSGAIVLPCWTPDNYRNVYIKLHGIKFRLTKNSIEPI